jgi:FKBP-type peptidyl-prolyl cis-trans isomerase
MKKYFFLVLLIAPFIGRAQAQDGYIKLPNATQYKIFTANPGDKIKVDDVITFNMIQKTEKDSVLFSTYTQGRPIQIQIKPTEGVGDMMYIFPLLAAKDSAVVRLSADSVFKGHEEARPPFLPTGSVLVFVLKIERIQSLQDAIAERNAAMAAQKAAMDKMKADEVAIAAKYITDHKMVVKTTLSGLKYVITTPSLKTKVTSGDTLLVNYAGRTTDDKLFDSSIETIAKAGGLVQPGRTYEPIKFVVGQGQVIKGWDEGLELLNEGSKATLVIPSSLGYGDQGQGDAIPPYSTLVFDVEVVKVIKGKAPVKKTTKAPAKKPGTKTAVKKTTAPAKKPATGTSTATTKN